MEKKPACPASFPIRGGDTKPLSVSDISTQDPNFTNVNPRPAARPPSIPSKNSQIRHRASIACASCRDRRIRCVVPKGKTECVACRRAGTKCIIKNDDERRRPISKAYMSSLSDRIALLEGMLMERGVVPPPAVHPPKTRQEAQMKQQHQNENITLLTEAPLPQQIPVFPHPGSTSLSQLGGNLLGSSPDSDSEAGFTFPTGDPEPQLMSTTSQQFSHPPLILPQSQPLVKEPSPFCNFSPQNEELIYRLLSTKGNLSFDQLSGRVRFYGPTANSHVFASESDQFDTHEPLEQSQRAECIIRSLAGSTHDYLMNLFWDCYNSILHVIDRAAFEADQESQNPKFYSSFLHITILAVGYRFCDRNRDDMRKITMGNWESCLHREAKSMLDIELERPGGIPSVQALLLLGDLECGVGRDNTGWMYSGMATRLAFDIGLHLGCPPSSEVSEIEVSNRALAMRACVICDKYWALFLGRPTSIKSQDIGVDLLTKRFSGMLNNTFPLSLDSEQKRPINEEIYEQLVELMEIAGRIVESRSLCDASDRHWDSRVINHGNVFDLHEADSNAYMHVVDIDRQLQSWYRRLPNHLVWSPANIKTAPFSYFLLHQQYHVSMILLHRPWAKYGDIGQPLGNSSTGGSNHPSPTGQDMPPLPFIPQSATSLNLSTPFPVMPSHAQPGLDLRPGEMQSLLDEGRTSLSRTICTQQALQVARIFAQHRARFDPRKIFVTGIQHAGTAAIALIAALTYQTNETDRRACLVHLETLADAINDMAHTYHPAAKMKDLLAVILGQLRGEVRGSERTTAAHQHAFGSSVGSTWQSSSGSMCSPVVPQRREAEGELNVATANKKRRSGPTLAFACPQPPFFAIPPNSSAPRDTPEITAGCAHHQSSFGGGGLGDVPAGPHGLFGVHSGGPHPFALGSLGANAIEDEGHPCGMDEYVLVNC